MLIRLPRLNAKAASEKRKAFIAGETEFIPADFADALSNSDASFPTTAGRPIEFKKLEELRQSCLAAVESAEGDSTTLDVLLGAEIYRFGHNYQGDLGNPQVWDFLTLILLPDVAARRFSPRETNVNRFIGGHRRHVLQRLWRRWIVLGPTDVRSQRLREDDYGLLLERRMTSEKPKLAQMTAQKIINSGFTEDARRRYARIFIKRLQQISGVVVLDENDSENLEAVLHEIDEQVRDEVVFAQDEETTED